MRRFLRFLFYFFSTLLILGAVLAGCFFSIYKLAQLGYVKIPVWVKVQGSSMEPTLKHGLRVKFYYFFKNYPLGRGDIITFSNETTLDEQGNKVGYVKRIVGLPNEEVMLRDGFLTISGQVLNEPYVSVKKSTYSESFVPECKKVKVPENKFFVLGDNRMSSKDSRDFGFVEKKDITAILYYYGQPITFSDLNITLDKDSIISSLNQQRALVGKPVLQEVAKLNQAALMRVKAIIEFKDWTEGAKKSNFSYQDAIKLVNYKNILYAEIIDGGYLSVEDMINTWKNNEGAKNIYLDARYEHIGVAVLLGQFGDCQMPVISAIFGGYEPPNYSSDVIGSWKNALAGLKKIQPSWESLKNKSIYQVKKQEIDRICEIISLRIYRINQILDKMQKNQYLSEEEEQWIKTDKRLGEEQTALAEEINQYISSH